MFLAAPGRRDWQRLTVAMADWLPELAGPAWRSPHYRAEHDAELVLMLEKAFGQQAAPAWERHLLAADVGCVVAEDRPMESSLLGEFGQQSGFVQNAYSPVFDVYPRLGPLVEFSRSTTLCQGGCTAGQHTDEILAALGYPADRVAELRQQGVVG